MLAVQSSPVHSKEELCLHQCLTLEVLQACKGLLSTVTFSRKVKFGIWAVPASSSLVPPGVHGAAVSLAVIYATLTVAVLAYTTHDTSTTVSSLLRDSIQGIRNPDPCLPLFEGLRFNLQADILFVTFLWSFLLRMEQNRYITALLNGLT